MSTNTPSAMHKNPTVDEQRQQWLMEELRAPTLRELCTPGHGTSIVGRLDEVDFILSGDDLVKKWITSGANLDDLALLLQERPRLLEVDLIREQLFHLHALARGFMPLADALMGMEQHKQKAAQENLKRVAEGMVRGLLPGYSADIAMAAPNGRPREMDQEELLQNLNGLLVALEFMLEKDSLILLRKRHETQGGFTLRIARIAQNLFQNSHLSFRASSSPYKPFLDGEGHPAVYLDPRSLDLATAWRIGKPATQKRQSASFKRLVCGILEHQYQISARALENHLARLKITFPGRFTSILKRFPRLARQF
ncbi:MAG: hypothetical protein ABIU05_20920 [Nitrospirales bacterium]